MVAPTCLGRVRSKMNFVNASRPDLNSGLNSFNYKIQRDGIDKNTNKINKHNWSISLNEKRKKYSKPH